jgi:hypothetical protein
MLVVTVAMGFQVPPLDRYSIATTAPSRAGRIEPFRTISLPTWNSVGDTERVTVLLILEDGAAGGAETTKLTVVKWVVVPAVPVIVSVVVAAGVWLVVVTVSVDVPVGETADGLKEPVAPAGKPVTPKDTLVLKPPIEAKLTV